MSLVGSGEGPPAAARDRLTVSGPTPAPAIPASLNSSRRDKLLAIFIFLCEVVADDHAALHDELHPLHFSDVGERIARNSDDICEFAFLDTAYLGFPAIVQHMGGCEISCLQRLGVFHAPFRVIAKLIGLLSV